MEMPSSSSEETTSLSITNRSQGDKQTTKVSFDSSAPTKKSIKSILGEKQNASASPLEMAMAESQPCQVQ